MPKNTLNQSATSSNGRAKSLQSHQIKATSVVPSAISDGEVLSPPASSTSSPLPTFSSVISSPTITSTFETDSPSILSAHQLSISAQSSPFVVPLRQFSNSRNQRFQAAHRSEEESPAPAASSHSLSNTPATSSAHPDLYAPLPAAAHSLCSSGSSASHGGCFSSPHNSPFQQSSINTEIIENTEWLNDRINSLLSSLLHVPPQQPRTLAMENADSWFQLGNVEFYSPLFRQGIIQAKAATIQNTSAAHNKFIMGSRSFMVSEPRELPNKILKLIEPLNKLLNDRMVYPRKATTVQNVKRREEVFAPLFFDQKGIFVYPWLSQDQATVPINRFERFVTAGCMFGSAIKGVSEFDQHFNLIKHDIQFHLEQRIEWIQFNPLAHFNAYEEALFAQFRSWIALMKGLSKGFQDPVVYHHLPAYDYILFGVSLYLQGRMTLKALDQFCAAILLRKEQILHIMRPFYESLTKQLIIKSPFEYLFSERTEHYIGEISKAFQQGIENKQQRDREKFLKSCGQLFERSDSARGFPLGALIVADLLGKDFVKDFHSIQEYSSVKFCRKRRPYEIYLGKPQIEEESKITVDFFTSNGSGKRSEIDLCTLKAFNAAFGEMNKSSTSISFDPNRNQEWTEQAALQFLLHPLCASLSFSWCIQYRQEAPTSQEKANSPLTLYIVPHKTEASLVTLFYFNPQLNEGRGEWETKSCAKAGVFLGSEPAFNQTWEGLSALQFAADAKLPHPIVVKFVVTEPKHNNQIFLTEQEDQQIKIDYFDFEKGSRQQQFLSTPRHDEILKRLSKTINFQIDQELQGAEASEVASSLNLVLPRLKKLAYDCLTRLKLQGKEEENDDERSQFKLAWRKIVSEEKKENINTVEDLFKKANALMIYLASQNKHDHKTCSLLPVTEKQIQLTYQQLSKEAPKIYPPVFNLTALDPIITTSECNNSKNGLLFYYDDPGALNDLIVQGKIIDTAFGNVYANHFGGPCIGIQAALESKGLSSPSDQNPSNAQGATSPPHDPDAHDASGSLNPPKQSFKASLS